MSTQEKPKNYYKTKEHLASIKHISHPYLNRNDEVSGRIYFAFGDVHGEFDMMMDALENAGFDILNDDHHIISLGDSFDRGRQNLAVYQFLMWMISKKRLVSILGNHDTFLQEFIDHNRLMFDFNTRHNGLDRTIGEFADVNHWEVRKYDMRTLNGKAQHLNIRKFLSHTVPYFELGQFIFTHAGMTEVDDGAWEINNWAQTPAFVKNYRIFGRTHVFGHWGAFKLEDKGVETWEGMPFIHKYGGFIGLDAWCGISKHILVAKFAKVDGDWELVSIDV